ncbi:MAG TPA: alpha/beta family hydrolase [Actinomycetota bacterium]|nr:alpha/beta family hydrolase [Actinomycetota bacterium]
MAVPEEGIQIETARGSVSGAWAGSPGALATLVVAHGAGAGMAHPFLVGFTRELNAARIATLRFNFPYFERGRRSPDPESVLREAWLAAFRTAASRSGGVVLAGGKSLGGRIASMVVADGMPAAGLVLVGYPLHPPGKPKWVRDEHLYRVEVPMLFLQGTADPFAQPKLIARVLRRLGERATHEPVEGGDHSFRVRGVRADDREIGAGLARRALPFVERVARGE